MAETSNQVRASQEPRYGVVVYVKTERRFGRIRAQNGQSLPFLFSEWSGLDYPDVPTPVQFQIARHPHDAERLVAKKVRAVQLPWLSATVVSIGPTYGFLRLDDGRSVYFDA